MADDPGSPHTPKAESSPHTPLTPKAESSQQSPHEDPRWSQYAENRPNPLPELAVDPDAAPEPVSNVEELKAQNDANPFAGVPVFRPPGSIQPDGGDPRSPAVVFNEPELSWIAKHKSWVIAGLLLAVVILVAVVVGVVVKNRKGSSNGGGAAVTSIPASTSVSSTSASVASASASSAPTECAPSNFKAKASFMGITGVMGGWTTSFAATSDGVGCCTYCYRSVPSGCNGWMWVPNADGSMSGTSCVLISGWAGTNSDSTCPSGYTSVSILTQAPNASHVGGAGPCGTVS